MPVVALLLFVRRYNVRRARARANGLKQTALLTLLSDMCLNVRRESRGRPPFPPDVIASFNTGAHTYMLKYNSSTIVLFVPQCEVRLGRKVVLFFQIYVITLLF